jgi:aspartate aminotransferase-like enzyme
MLLVDAVSSLGAIPIETDRLGLDFVFTASQKALALPPGLALGVASPRIIERARIVADRGRYLDLAAWHEAATRQQPLTTPTLPLLYALEAQLARIAAAGGVEPRCRRHYDMLLAVEAWVAEHPGFDFLAAEGRRSWTVSCLTLPPGMSGPGLVGRLAERGWTVAPGYGPLRERTIRIGHMGDVGVEALGELLKEIEELDD